MNKIAAVNQNDPYFSVVVPVYNVEPYLATCLDGLLARRSNDFEVIAVNDCSPDGCGLILDNYAAHDSRIKVVTLECNSGVSAARNKGVEVARGGYILFVDPDDTLDPSAFDELKCLAERAKPDIVLFGHRRVTESGVILKESKPGGCDDFDLNVEKELIRGFDCFAGNLLAWNGLYCAELIKSIMFKALPNGEDVLFGVEAFCHSNKVCVLDKILYNYLQRAESASKVASSMHCCSSIQVCKEIFDVVGAHGKFESLKPLLFRKIRAMSHGLVLQVLGRVPPDDQEVCWCKWFDVFGTIYCGTGLVPVCSRPVYRLIFAARIPVLAKICFQLPVALAGGLLRNKVFASAWGKLRKLR